MNKKIWAIKIFAAAGVIFLSGCAFGVRKPFLSYSPVLPAQHKNNIVIKVVPFKDERKTKDTVGYVRNSLGMKCAKVVPQNNVAKWVTDSLKSELRNAGYTVSGGDNVSNVVQGSVLDIFCDTYLTYDGRAALKIVLKRGGKVILSKDYSVKKNGGMNLAATSKAFAKTLEMTLQEVLKQVVSDVNKLLLKQTASNEN